MRISLLHLWAVTAQLAGAVDLATCKSNLQKRLDNRTLFRDDPIFYFNGTTHMSGASEMWLTISGCQNNCPKPNFDLYSDMWPRLLTWLVPALLLIGSVHLPRVGHINRLFIIFHFVGDPIDSMWALLTKSEVWNRFYGLALRVTPSGPEKLATARALAAILSAFEELTGDMATVQQEIDTIVTENGARLSREDLDYVLRDSRGISRQQAQRGTAHRFGHCQLSLGRPGRARPRDWWYPVQPAGRPHRDRHVSVVVGHDGAPQQHPIWIYF